MTKDNNNFENLINLTNNPDIKNLDFFVDEIQYSLYTSNEN